MTSGTAGSRRELVNRLFEQVADADPAGGCSGAPQAPAGFTAVQSGAVPYPWWERFASGAAPSSFTLGVSSAVFTGSVPLGSARRCSTPAPPGRSTFTIRGATACGTGAATAPQTAVIP